MKTGASLKNRQGGAVAVMVGISIVVLVGFLALVIDLSRVYLARTGLQNAADAAALSGAKQLDGTAARICCGVDSAVAWARRTGGGPGSDGNPNNTFFGGDLYQVQVDVGPLNTTNDKISFSASPDGPWVNITSAQASPSDKYFIKVDTASEAIKPLFAVVWNIINMGTYGTAVAGPLVKNVAPLGVCAIDVITAGSDRACGGSGSECGFLRGVAYNILTINPLGFSAYPVWLNPVDVPPGTCDPNHASANFMRPFVCEGKAAVGNVPGQVYANTGASATLEVALNSRFDIFGGGANACDPATAPPDINIKQYMRNPGPLPGGGCPPDSNNANCGHPRDWTDPTNNTTPTRQDITIDPATHLPRNYPATTVGYFERQPQPGTVPPTVPPDDFESWGALWSYTMEQNFSTGAAYKLCDWDNTCTPKTWTNPADPLYNGLYRGAADQTANGYPAAGTPYQATSGSKYFNGPNPSRPGKADRRVLNLLIIDCGAPGYPFPGPGASCAQLQTLAVGKFFMPVQADFSGPTKSIYGEFAGLLPASLVKKQYILYQ